MLYLKKYFTEGLIQVAILISLCGLRVDVGLEPMYLPSSLHEMIMGPTSGITQTQFHNPWNHIDDRPGHPKSVDLDGFFTTRRLLNWVRSLDRLQVPNAELETWLVHKQPDVLSEHPVQSPPVERAPGGLEEDRAGAALEAGTILITQEEEGEREDNMEFQGGGLQESLWTNNELSRSSAWIDQYDHEEAHHQAVSNQNLYRDSLNEDEDDEEGGVGEEGEDIARISQSKRERRDSCSNINNRDSAQNDQASLSLQQCLRMLEDTYPFTPQQSIEILPVNGGAAEYDCLSGVRAPPLCPLIPTDQPSLDLEQQWQDLWDIMEPEDMNVNNPFLTNQDSDATLNFSSSQTFQNPLDATILCNHHSNPNSNSQMIHQDVPLMEAAFPPGRGSFNHPEQTEPSLLPLIPSTELDEYNMRFNTRESYGNININNLGTTPYNSTLNPEHPLDNLSWGLDIDDAYSTFSMDPATQDAADSIDNTNTGPHSICALSPGTRSNFDMIFYPSSHSPSPFTPPCELNGANPSLSVIPSSQLLIDDDDEEDDDNGLPSPLGDLLEDATILDEMSQLDLALQEGFSPEMAAQLEQEGYLEPEAAKRNVQGLFYADVSEREEGNDGTSWSLMATRHEQGNSRTLRQDSEEKVDSDSGLSLDFSFSPASPCGSEASCYSSSSTSSSSSSSADSTPGSLYSEGDEQREVNIDFELELTIKKEEEEGAVGGFYPSDVTKMAPLSYQERKLYHQEHISHDHAYNRPWPSTPTLAAGKMPIKSSKSSSRHSSTNPYHVPRSPPGHFPEAKLWGRDECTARSMKIPFSNELIVNLPVEEFNELLANHPLNEQQLELIRDIRRRGKNKMAAQNCRRRKMGVLLGLEEDVSGLRRRRAWLRREKREALESLQEMKRRLGELYQDTFSTLRNEEGRPLNATDYVLQFGPDGSVTVTSRQHRTLPQVNGKASKKQKDKKYDGRK